jgi:alpha-L-rhamnosidase
MIRKVLLAATLLTTPLLAQRGVAVPEHLTTGSLTAQDPRLSWTLRAPLNAERGIRQTAYQIRVATTPQLLRADHADLWDSAQVLSSVMNAAYGGKPLPQGEPVVWQVRTWQTTLSNQSPVPSDWSEPAAFTTPLGSWSAKWIAASPDSPSNADPLKPLPLFRHTVTVTSKPVQAILFVTGLGQYEVRLNGHNVTTNVLTPGWTDYRKTILYDTYDVLPLLQNGANALAVLLGNGMYNVPKTPGRYSKFSGSMGQPKLLLELHLTLADGTHRVVASDGAWRTAPGPITFSNTYGGEDVDARLEPAGWDTAGFDDSTWTPATIVASPGGQLVPEQTPPIRPLQLYTPISTTQPNPGVMVYDLGENFAGWPLLAAIGPAGATVRLLPGELLDAHGLVTQHSANASPKHPVLFSYTLRGDKTPELWHPRFSYYGFRYVQVETSSPEVKIVSLSGQATHADATQVGHFTSSNPLFDRIHTLILNAARSNMVSVLTDCPHREKLGWLEQTHLFAESLMANYDVSALYRKLSDDMADAQLPSGLVPAIAPEYVQFLDDAGRNTDFRDSPEWGSAVVLSPWAAYEAYGDPGPLREHYESMQRYVAYLQSKATGNLLDYGLGDWYDIGPGAPGYAKLTSKRLTATATLYEDLVAMTAIAHVLEKTEDETRYSRQAEEVRGAFNAALFHPDTNQYDRGSQTADAMPLALGMVPPEHRAAVLANLVADIEAHGYHVTAGDVGFHYVVRALTDEGRSDVLEKMLSLTTSPSYGYQLAQGATTLTEAWDTNPNSSQNHFMLGHGEEWFYRGLAGIDIDLSRKPADQIRLRPYVPTDQSRTTNASATIETPLGMVRCAWSKTGDGAVTIEVTVPPNATATLWLPAAYRTWTESGLSLTDAIGVSSTSDQKVVTLESGNYRLAGTP